LYINEQLFEKMYKKSLCLIFDFVVGTVRLCNVLM